MEKVVGNARKIVIEIRKLTVIKIPDFYLSEKCILSLSSIDFNFLFFIIDFFDLVPPYNINISEKSFSFPTINQIQMESSEFIFEKVDRYMSSSVQVWYDSYCMLQLD